MTKLKKKDEYSLPEGCFNCRFSEVITEEQMWCNKRKLLTDIYYKCKKWRIQE